MEAGEDDGIEPVVIHRSFGPCPTTPIVPAPKQSRKRKRSPARGTASALGPLCIFAILGARIEDRCHKYVIWTPFESPALEAWCRDAYEDVREIVEVDDLSDMTLFGFVVAHAFEIRAETENPAAKLSPDALALRIECKKILSRRRDRRCQAIAYVSMPIKAAAYFESPIAIERDVQDMSFEEAGPYLLLALP